MIVTLVRIRLVALLVLLALGAAACGASAEESTTDAASGGAALEGQFPTLDGGSIDLAEFEGQDVVLWFWAPW